MATIPCVLSCLRHEPLDSRIASGVEQLCGELGHEFRDRVFTPLVTIRLFILQVLHANTAITHLRQLIGFNFAPSSYCEARQRLPLVLLQSLLQMMPGWVDAILAGPLLLGGRVLVADGSSVSTPDAPGMLDHFQLPRGQKPGVGYPMAKIMGLMDAATGMFLQLLELPLFQHDMRGVMSVHRYLRAGDILLGDRALCSFAHFAVLSAAGVFGCFRLHHRRKDLRPGVQRWTKPRTCPVWMTAAQFERLPKSIEVRLVRYVVAYPGFRTHEVFVATTLMDENLWPDQAIARMYARRWSIELCFRHLKTTMKMDMLKCQSVEGVLKELAIYLMVYNMVRLVMLKAADKMGVDVDRVSFIDAARCLASYLLGLEGVVELIVNPARPGRVALRLARRRKKPFNNTTKPRAAYRQASHPQGVGD